MEEWANGPGQGSVGMCVAISGQDVLDYIFSSLPEKSCVSYDEMDCFRKKFTSCITKLASSNSYYSTVYYEPLRALSERHYDGILVRSDDGVRLFGEVRPDVALGIEARYEDENVSQALKDAVGAVRHEIQP